MGVDGELYCGKYSKCPAQHMDHSISLVLHQRANILKSNKTTVNWNGYESSFTVGKLQDGYLCSFLFNTLNRRLFENVCRYYDIYLHNIMCRISA